MASQSPDLATRIAENKQNLANVQNQRAASKARSGGSSSNGQEAVAFPRSEGASPTNRGGGTGTAGVAVTEGNNGARTGAVEGAQSRTELGPVDEESSADEEKAPPITAVREKGKSVERPSSRSTNSNRSETGSPPQAPNPNPENQTRPTGGASSRAARVVSQMDTDLNEAQRKLLDELVDINGQDSYDALAAGVGKLKQSEYLVLPNGFTIRPIEARIVGKPQAHEHTDIRVWAQIYALNKAVAPEGADGKIYGMLRLEAVKCGWLDSQRELRFATPPTDALRTLATDLAEIRDRIGTIKTASFLLPMIAEHVFRTFGHHFISTDAANYTERYNSTLRSCLAPDVIGLLPPAVMFHAALHWVSPGRAWRVLQAQLESTNMPDALRIRASAAPAGTAILTTTAAIIESMAAVGLDALFEQHGSFALDTIRRRTAEVKANPPRFHKSYFAYGVPGPSQQEVQDIEAAKQIAIKFSPFAQAYINSYMREAALGKAQALKKHAEQNPVQLRLAQNLFRAISRRDVNTVEDLFTMALGKRNSDDDF